LGLSAASFPLLFWELDDAPCISMRLCEGDADDDCSSRPLFVHSVETRWLSTTLSSVHIGRDDCLRRRLCLRYERPCIEPLILHRTSSSSPAAGGVDRASGPVALPYRLVEAEKPLFANKLQHTVLGRTLAQLLGPLEVWSIFIARLQDTTS
jgi:hypothetical protein